MLQNYHLKKEAKIQEDQIILVSQYENRIADLENQLREAVKSQSSSSMVLVGLFFLVIIQQKPSTFLSGVQNQEEYNAVLQKSELLAQRLASMEVLLHF